MNVMFCISVIRSISEYKATSPSIFTITLAGHPFTDSSIGDSEAACVSLRSAWCHLLAELAGQGWQLVTACDLAQKRSNSTIFFRCVILQTSRLYCKELNSLGKWLDNWQLNHLGP